MAILYSLPTCVNSATCYTQILIPHKTFIPNTEILTHCHSPHTVCVLCHHNSTQVTYCKYRNSHTLSLTSHSMLVKRNTFIAPTNSISAPVSSHRSHKKNLREMHKLRSSSQVSIVCAGIYQNQTYSYCVCACVQVWAAFQLKINCHRTFNVCNMHTGPQHFSHAPEG